MTQSACLPRRAGRKLHPIQYRLSPWDSRILTPASALDAISMYMLVLKAHDTVPSANTVHAVFMANFLPSVSIRTPYMGITACELVHVQDTVSFFPHAADYTYAPAALPRLNALPK